MAEQGRHQGKAEQRGVTRPQALRKLQQMRRRDREERRDRSHRRPDGNRASRRERLVMHHRQTLWIPWTLILLGIWTLVAPATLGYGSATVMPAGGRAVWLSLDARIAAMTWSDIVSGALLVVLGWRALTPGRALARWAACFVGIWLTAAPLLFWAPTSAAYLNDTLVGALVIGLTILIPGMPNMILFMKMGGQTPPGWSYNPSSWPQRWIMIALGFAGWMVSRYLAAFQLGYIDRVWDPFFGDGTRQVLTSNMSEAWPVSDAGLGALTYTFEFLMGFMGSPARWRTMPWMVTFFGIVVIPLGLVHIFLVISQPIVVGAWCTFCLLAAAIMLPMIPLEADEVIAMGQHMRDAKRRGESLWQVFWKGGSPDGALEDDRTPPLHRMPLYPGRVMRASVFGMSVPWNLVVTAALGVWLMFAPAVFGVGRPASSVDHLCGALVVTASVIAFGEVLRAVRLFNVPLAIGIAFAPFFIPGGDIAWHAHGVVVGLLILVFSIRKGPQRETYGRWDRLVW